MIHSPRQRRYIALSAFLESFTRTSRAPKPRQDSLKALRSTIAAIATMAVMSTLLVFGLAAPASAAVAANPDSCGYNPGGNPIFSESTLVKAAQVVGSGASAKIAVYSDDEWATLLGVNGASAMPATTAASPAAHVSNPSLGDTTSLDASGRPQYPALFITDQGTSKPAVPITTDDWQNGGSPVTSVQDVFGTWVTATDVGGVYTRGAIPPFKNNSNGAWILGPGSDPLPTGNSITSFVGVGDSSPTKTEGYGSELRWDASALGLTPGHYYRVQVLTHDGDQNKSGGDVGEACLTLEIPGTTQHLTGHIYDCTTNATTTEVTGGTLSASGPTPVPQQANPLDASVSVGTYTVDAGAPTGYHFVDCGKGTNDSGTSATRSNVDVPANGTGTATFYVAPDQPDLTIVKSANATTVNAGDSFDYTLDVENTGGGAATATVVKDTIPTGLTIGTITPSVGHCTKSGQDVSCALGTLASKATASIKIHVTTTTAACGIVKNTGTVEATNNAKVTSNEVDVTVVCPNPNLDITKSASATTVTAGDAFDYTLVVTSTGGTAATAVTVTDDIPAGLSIVGTPTSTLGNCSATSGQHVSCSIGDLAAANANSGTKSATIVVHVRTSVTTCGIVSNTGHASAANVTTVDSNRVDVNVDCPLNGNLVKGNDADADGTFHQSETADLPGMDVPFQVTLTNTSAIPVVIDSISDAFGSKTVIPQCAKSFVGQTVAAGASITCDFTLSNYSPAAGSSLENTATVTVHDKADPNKKKTFDSTSVVNTAGVPPLSLTVVKTNNANGDTVFTKDETGVTNASVDFRVSITNTSAVPVTIDSITDVWPDATEFAPACAASIVGTTLDANGGTVSCDFTVANYVPASTAGPKTNTVTVKVHQPGNPGNTTTQKDTSTVRGEPPAVLGETVVRALPRTGSNTMGLVGIAILLLVVGLGLTLLSSGRIPQAALALRSSALVAPAMYIRNVPIVERNLGRGNRRKIT